MSDINTYKKNIEEFWQKQIFFDTLSCLNTFISKSFNKVTMAHVIFFWYYRGDENVKNKKSVSQIFLLNNLPDKLI